MQTFTQYLNCEKIAGDITFLRSEPDQNCDANRMYSIWCIADAPMHNLTEC